MKYVTTVINAPGIMVIYVIIMDTAIMMKNVYVTRDILVYHVKSMKKLKINVHLLKVIKTGII